MVRQVRVVPHDPKWRRMYEDLAAALLDILGDAIQEIHHMGSTAIPGICAKPIIHILVAAQDIAAIDDFDGVMRDRGYEPRGENGRPSLQEPCALVSGLQVRETP